MERSAYLRRRQRGVRDGLAGRDAREHSDAYRVGFRRGRINRAKAAEQGALDQTEPPTAA